MKPKVSFTYSLTPEEVAEAVKKYIIDQDGIIGNNPVVLNAVKGDTYIIKVDRYDVVVTER